ncbi:SNase-domain-containing protein [Pyrenophora tritici-repentis]|nr:SNase-domain-containing protein [Pyrenophora tritici-repentis]
MGYIAEVERLAKHSSRATDPDCDPRTNSINGCWSPPLQDLPTAHPDRQSYQAQLLSSQKFVWPSHERRRCRQLQAVSHTWRKDSWMGLAAMEKDTDQKGGLDKANIDAPELAHWGREAQPFSKEAHDWLINLIHNRRVRAYIYRRDQYDRVVAQVYVRRWLFRKDVGLEMLRAGLATVYEAKTGAEFGTVEDKYRAAEQKARDSKVGMWAKPTLRQRLGGAPTQPPESPREYKNRHNAAEKLKKPG